MSTWTDNPYLLEYLLNQQIKRKARKEAEAVESKESVHIRSKMLNISPQQSLDSLSPSPCVEHNLGMQKIVNAGNKIIDYNLRIGMSYPITEICEVRYLDQEGTIHTEIICAETPIYKPLKSHII